MVSQLWVFVAGVLVSQQLPSLPSALPCSIALVGAAIAARTRLCWASIFIVGVMYGVARGHFALEHQLPEVLESTEVRLVGTVVGLPVSRRDGARPATRFVLSIEQVLGGPDTAN